MSDLHRLPLVGHDLPYYVVTDQPEVLQALKRARYRVYCKRATTGQPYWYWRKERASGYSVVGPFLSCADAHKDIERSQGYAKAGPAR